MWVESARSNEFKESGPQVHLTSSFTYETSVPMDHPCPMAKSSYDLRPAEAQALSQAIHDGKVDIGPKPSVHKKE